MAKISISDFGLQVTGLLNAHDGERRAEPVADVVSSIVQKEHEATSQPWGSSCEAVLWAYLASSWPFLLQPQLSHRDVGPGMPLFMSHSSRIAGTGQTRKLPAGRSEDHSAHLHHSPLRTSYLGARENRQEAVAPGTLKHSLPHCSRELGLGYHAHGSR